MKRIFSVALIVATLFSFASCRNIDELQPETTAPTTTIAPPVINEKKQQKEFKDENGRTVYVVDVTLPEISENLEEYIIRYVNSVTDKFFTDACAQAEENINSASEFMDEFGSDKPWKKTISFDTTYASRYFLSFLIKESLSFYGSSNNAPSVYSSCFNVQEGNPVNATYFAKNSDDPEEVKGYIVELIKERAKTDFYADGYEINEEKLAKFDTEVSLDDFYLTENGMAFFVSRGAIDPYETSGLYVAEFTWEELESFFNKPDLY